MSSRGAAFLIAVAMLQGSEEVHASFEPPGDAKRGVAPATVAQHIDAAIAVTVAAVIARADITTPPTVVRSRSHHTSRSRRFATLASSSRLALGWSSPPGSGETAPTPRAWAPS